MKVIYSALIASMMLAACTSQRSMTPQNDVAIFENFNYTGNDDFYNRNPLPDKSSYYNPILPGSYPDPSVCTNGVGDYYMVNSSFGYYPGIPIFHSTDLVNWEQIGHVLDRPSQLSHIEHQGVSGGIFAPSIEYNPINKTYYVITSDVGWGNFYVKSTDPAGPWSDPILVPEIIGIDPSIFFDNNGKAYIVHNADAPDFNPEYDGHRTIKIWELNPITDKIVGGGKVIVNKGANPDENPVWCEAPHLYKINDKYYLITAEGGTGLDHREMVYRADSPWGPYEAYEGNPILTQSYISPNATNAVTCTGHADLLRTTNDEWWSVFLGVRPVNGIENLGRETYLMPVEWTEDGWPIITKPGDRVWLTGARQGVERGEHTTFGNLSYHDEFDCDSLEFHYHGLRGDASMYFDFTSNPGSLTLRCGDYNSRQKEILAYVGQRIQHHNFEVSTRMCFEAQNRDQNAGLLVFKDEGHQYLMVRGLSGNQSVIRLVKVSPYAVETLVEKELDNDNPVVDLRIQGNGPTFNFSYSTDEGNSWETLMNGVDAAHTSTAEAGGFTGTSVGMYASNNN